MKESQVNVITTLIANGQPPVSVEPGEGAFHHPPVSAQLLAAFYSLTRYAAFDAPLAQRLSAPGYVIRLVSVPFVWALARTTRLTAWTRDRIYAVHHLLKHPRVVSIGTRQFHRKWYSFGFDHRSNATLALRAGHPLGVALICGVAPNSRGFWVPFFTPLAWMVSLSTLTRRYTSTYAIRASITRYQENLTSAVQVPLTKPFTEGATVWSA